MLEYIRKRDGRLVPFEEGKIAEAIQKAVRAVGGVDMEKPVGISREVGVILDVLYKDGRIPTVENVQDLVEKILIENGHAKTAKAYILYRKQHESAAPHQGFMKESIEAIDSYLAQEDWRVNENANMGYSLQGLNNHIAANITSNYWLNKIYPSTSPMPTARAISTSTTWGCSASTAAAGTSRTCCSRASPGPTARSRAARPSTSAPPSGRPSTSSIPCRARRPGPRPSPTSTPCSPPSSATTSSATQEVKQSVQEFIFNMNVPTRVGFQTPFTNITLDMTPPKNMADQAVIIGGELMEATYGEFQAEMDLFNRAFCEVMMEGDASGRIFSFPIPTYNITAGFDWDSLRFQPIWEMTAKYGIPYFSNFINSDMDPEDARSMCCRLRLDNRELRRRGGGLFGSNPLTGSIGVVTLNLPAGPPTRPTTKTTSSPASAR